MMNSARLDELERSISGVAKKVLHIVPVAEPWTPKEIHAEAIRSGHNIDRRTLEGCLNSLRDTGLVREPDHGSFIRVTARPQVSVVPATVEVPKHLLAAKKVAPAGEKDQEPLEKLAAIATALRAHAKSSLELAERVEAVGIEVSDQIQRVQEGGAKLKQLQEVLKSIGIGQ